jgi:dTDP-4-dehydrorhamnose reductase
MKTCLIGYTGLVGSNLLRQYNFDFLYNSKNIISMINQEYDLIICSGISANKWYANQNNNEDIYNINILLDILKTVKCNKFILISTIDVYPNTNIEVNETYNLDNKLNHNYGTNRYYVENFVKQHFNNYHIIRLSGLFGFGLKKNIIYDLLNDNNPILNKESQFQWYYLGDLKKDIDFCINNNIKLINLFNEPIYMYEILNILEKYKKLNYTENNNIITYKLRTQYTNLGYLNVKNYVINQLDNFFWLYTKNNICISNLGYDLNNINQIINIEKFYNIKKREIVPYKTFDNLFENNNLEYFTKYKDLNIYSMQSILYPKTENILQLKIYLLKLIDIASYLEVKILVLGSPKNRSLNNMTKDNFVLFMKEIGDYAYSKNVIIVIEPNAKIYNCDFITTSNEAIDIINEINSNGIKLHLDIGCMFLENENIFDVINKNIDLIYHIHISAPHLSSLTEYKEISYNQIFKLLKNLNYKHYITFEFLNITIDNLDKSIFLFLC